MPLSASANSQPCPVTWHPYLPNPFDTTHLGATTRSDGSTQVTYAGKPLYFYAHEGKHQVLCHNVTEFGGRWLAVAATGDPAPI